MRKTKGLIRKGFSLIELVIVVVIIGIIAAIAIPKLSRGSAGAGDSALSADLLIWRQALELYAAEHGGLYPSQDKVSQQLTLYSSSDGTTGGYTPSAGLVYGPYLLAIPTMPIGSEKGTASIGTQPAPGTAWVYTTDGYQKSYILQANVSGFDSQGVAYSSY